MLFEQVFHPVEGDLLVGFEVGCFGGVVGLQAKFDLLGAALFFIVLVSFQLIHKPLRLRLRPVIHPLHLICCRLILHSR
jgi:hypothetical protein